MESQFKPRAVHKLKKASQEGTQRAICTAVLQDGT